MTIKVGDKEIQIYNYPTPNNIQILAIACYQQGAEDALNKICKMSDEHCNACDGECYDCKLHMVNIFADKIKEEIPNEEIIYQLPDER